MMRRLFSFIAVTAAKNCVSLFAHSLSVATSRRCVLVCGRVVQDGGVIFFN